MYLKELTNAEFNIFTNKFNLYSIYQTSEYGFVMNNQNYTSVFLGLIDDNNDICAASLILIEKIKGFKYAYAPKGFLIDYNNNYLVEKFTILIKEYLTKKRVMAIKLNPIIIKNIINIENNEIITNNKFNLQIDFLKSLNYFHLGYNNFFEAFKPRFDAIIDINKPLNILYNNIDKTFKRKIKNTNKCGIKVYKGNETNLIYLIDQVKKKYPRNKKYFEDTYFFFKKRNMIDYFYTMLDTNSYLIYIQNKYEKQISLCNELNNKVFKNANELKNNTKLINLKIREDNKLNELKKELVYSTKLSKEHSNGIVLATMLIIKYRDEVYVFMDGYNQKFKKINAKHLLTWKLIEKYSKEGYKKFNLGGITNPTIKDNKYNGLNEFKLNFNATPIEYLGDLELIINSTLYNLYRNSKFLKYILKRKK